MKIITFIRNLIKRGTVTKKTPDVGQFAVAQLKWIGDKTGNVEVIHPYGFSSYAPVGSLALMFNVMGHDNNRAAIINDPKRRFKNLKEGEVAIGNYLTESYVKFKENGDIEVIGTNNANVTVTGNVNLTVNGNVSATIGGTLTANITGDTDITSPIVTVNGEIRATGEVTAFYGLGGEISFTDIVTKYNAHTHNETGTVTNTPNNTLP